MKTIKIIKGIAIILIGIVIFTIKFYDISNTVMIDETEMQFSFFIRGLHFFEADTIQMYFNEFFKQTGINVILSLLFVGVGVMEIIESKGVK